MRRIKKFTAAFLAMAITVSLLAAMPLTASASPQGPSGTTSGRGEIYISSSAELVAEIDAINGAKRDRAALELTRSFEQNSTLKLNQGSNVDIYLNGYTLSIISTTAGDGIGIDLRNGGKLTVHGPGTLNVRGRIGIYVDGGKSDVNDTRSKFETKNGADMSVRTFDNLPNSVAVYAFNYGKISINGNVTASGTNTTGVYALTGGEAYVSGKVTASGNSCWGVYAQGKDSSIKIGGDVNASGRNSTGAFVKENGWVYLMDDCRATSTGSIGAEAQVGTIYIEDNVSGEGNDIKIGDRERKFGDPNKTGHLYEKIVWDEYSNGSSKVFTRQSSIGTGWRSAGGRDWHYFRNNNMLKEEWVQDGAWYYLKKNGFMARNDWLNIDSKSKTVSSSSGSPRYYFHDNGKMATGWFLEGRTWYYFKSSGAMARNEWVQSGGVWYWLKADGRMAAGETVRISGTNYTFNASGAWVDGGGVSSSGSWSLQNGVWYYIKAGGNRAANEWLQIGGVWYWFHGNGAMATGWIQQGFTWYWLKASGAMAANERITIDGKAYNFNASGACTNPY